MSAKDVVLNSNDLISTAYKFLSDKEVALSCAFVSKIFSIAVKDHFGKRLNPIQVVDLFRRLCGNLKPNQALEFFVDLPTQRSCISINLSYLLPGYEKGLKARQERAVCLSSPIPDGVPIWGNSTTSQETHTNISAAIQKWALCKMNIDPQATQQYTVSIQSPSIEHHSRAANLAAGLSASLSKLAGERLEEMREEEDASTLLPIVHIAIAVFAIAFQCILL